MIDLKFNEKFYNPIITGRKTQTTRTHIKNGLHAGETVNAVFLDHNQDYTDKKLLIQINEIVEKEFKDLKLYDAVREGYYSTSELKKVLTNIYPAISCETLIYCIRYEFKME